MAAPLPRFSLSLLCLAALSASQRSAFIRGTAPRSAPGEAENAWRTQRARALVRRRTLRGRRSSSSNAGGGGRRDRKTTNKNSAPRKEDGGEARLPPLRPGATLRCCGEPAERDQRAETRRNKYKERLKGQGRKYMPNKLSSARWVCDRTRKNKNSRGATAGRPKERNKRSGKEKKTQRSYTGPGAQRLPERRCRGRAGWAHRPRLGVATNALPRRLAHDSGPLGVCAFLSFLSAHARAFG